MKDVIIIEEVREKERLFEDIVKTIAPAELAQALCSLNLPIRYMCSKSKADLNVAKELEQASIMKY